MSSSTNETEISDTQSNESNELSEKLDQNQSNKSSCCVISKGFNNLFGASSIQSNFLPSSTGKSRTQILFAQPFDEFAIDQSDVPEGTFPKPASGISSSTRKTK